jgi:hypothetical protein
MRVIDGPRRGFYEMIKMIQDVIARSEATKQSSLSLAS